MKILFVGDASNFHNALAKALNEMGHTAIVVSDGSSWMNTDRDINLARKPGKVGAILYILRLISILPKLRGYDIVHIKNPIFLNLRPAKVRLVFDYLKRNNNKIYLSALGTDYHYVQACLHGSIYRYSDYKIGNDYSPHALNSKQELTNWTTAEMKEHHSHILSGVDGVISCLYEYYLAYKHFKYEPLGYAGIPIDTRSIKPNQILKEPEKVRFFIGIQMDRSCLKGTDKLLIAAKKIVEYYPDKAELYIAENVPYAEYLKQLSQSHVLLDQLYSYTPATNALLAMAHGLIAVSGAEDEYYNFIESYTNRPIFNVTPLVQDDIVQKLEWIVLNKQEIPELSRMSREFVERHNDSYIVANRHLEFWQKH